MRLSNKVILITGGASGIGKETACMCIKEGAMVVIGDIDARCKDVANDLGNRCFFTYLDISSEQSWQDFFAFTIDQCAKVDVLINNAAISGLSEGFGPQNPEELAQEDVRKINAVNIEGVVLGCRFAIAHMKKRGGVLVNIASRCGLVGTPLDAAYAMSKAAVINYTKTVALYCAQKKYDIRCNAISPAAIDAPSFALVTKGDEQEKEKIAQNIPLGRLGKPEDVAYAIVYLASEESSFVTGTNLIVDGGVLARI